MNFIITTRNAKRNPSHWEKHNQQNQARKNCEYTRSIGHFCNPCVLTLLKLIEKIRKGVIKRIGVLFIYIRTFDVSWN